MSFYFPPEGGAPQHVPMPGNRDQHSSATIMELQSQIGRLNLMIQTLSRLLIAKGIVQEQELDEWLRYVDSLDGVVDGKLRESKKPSACPNCKRMNPPTAVKCQYCGTEMGASFVSEP